MWAAPSPGTLILLPGLHSVLEPPPQGGRLPRLGRCAQEGQVVLKGVCGGAPGRAGPTGLQGWSPGELGLVLVSRIGPATLPSLPGSWQWLRA